MPSSGFLQEFFIYESHGSTRGTVERTPFVISARASARFGLLAVGLGVGLVSTPAIASADGLDFQISIDGYDLLPTAGNSATATSDMGGIAVAFGNGATASAGTGTGNFAFADGTSASAFAGGGNYNTAIDIGNNTSGPIPVGDDSTIGPVALAGAGNNDLALIIGGNNEANAGGDFLQSGYDSSHNIAFIFNPFGTGDDVVGAGVDGTHTGNYDLGGVLFDDNIINTKASGADYLYNIVTPSSTETNVPAAAVDSAATSLAAPAASYSDIAAALNDVYAFGQAGFAAATTDFGNGDFGTGLADLFQGIDAYSLIAPQDLIIGTAQTLANEPLDLFLAPDFGVPDTYADGVALTEQLFQVAQNLFTEASTSLASGDYPTALMDTLNGIDFSTVIPLETFILAGFAAS
jgi:hypothetical protein